MAVVLEVVMMVMVGEGDGWEIMVVMAVGLLLSQVVVTELLMGMVYRGIIGVKTPQPPLHIILSLSNYSH